MKSLLIVRLLGVGFFLFVLSACSSDTMQPVQRLSANGYQIDLLASNGTLTNGINALALEVTQNGAPVEVTEAHATFSMPAMGTMPYMETAAHFTANTDTQARGSVQFSMAGGWNVQLEVQTPQGPLTGSFKVQVAE